MTVGTVGDGHREEEGFRLSQSCGASEVKASRECPESARGNRRMSALDCRN